MGPATAEGHKLFYLESKVGDLCVLRMLPYYTCVALLHVCCTATRIFFAAIRMLHRYTVVAMLAGHSNRWKTVGFLPRLNFSRGLLQILGTSLAGMHTCIILPAFKVAFDTGTCG